MDANCTKEVSNGALAQVQIVRVNDLPAFAER